MDHFFQYLLKIFLLFLLSILSIIDLRTKETPYFLSFSLILSGFLSVIIYIMSDLNLNNLLEHILILLINIVLSFFISYFKYKFGLWGGGDFLVFIGISLYITILFPFLLSPIVFLIFIYLSTVFYNTFYLMVLYLKNRFFSKYELVFFIIIFVSMLTKKILMSILVFLTWTILVLHKINILYFIRKIPINKLREEDWLAYDIYKNNDIILKVNEVREGINREHIKFLKKKDVSFVYIKEGIPYLPTFLLAFILMLLFKYLNIKFYPYYFFIFNSFLNQISN